MKCPKYDSINIGEVACEECDSWVVIKTLPPSKRYPHGYAVQACSETRRTED